MRRTRATGAATLFLGAWLAGCGTPMPPAATTAPAAPPSQPAPRAAVGVTWQLTGTRNYETRSPGLGSSERYDSTVGWVDAYRYGMGRTDWATGVADPAFDAHFRGTIEDVRLLAQRGQYTDLRVGPPRDVRIGGLDFRTVTFQLRLRGQLHESRTYLTGLNGQLLKYRMSFPLPATGNLDDIARDFIERHLHDATDAIEVAAPPDRVQA
jgi:hypothetical protein